MTRRKLIAALFILSLAILAPALAFAANPTYGWTKRIGATGYVSGRDVAIDSGGNIYLTGMFSGTRNFAADWSGSDSKTSESQDIFITRVNANGTYGWTKKIGGICSADSGKAVAVDSSGNVYLTGYFACTVNFAADWGGSDSKTSRNLEDIFVTRINANGTYGWTKKMGGTGSFSAGSGISVDSSGNVYVSGYFQGTINFAADWSGIDSKTSAGGYDIYITKINTNGTYGWTKKIGGTGDDLGSAATIDSGGNVYISGSFSGSTIINFAAEWSGSDPKSSAGGGDIFVTKINSSGTYGWTKRIGGISSDGGDGLASDSIGNVYVTGYFSDTVNFASDWSGNESKSSAGGTDIFITRINANGTYGWTKRMGGTSGESGYDITVDSNRHVYLTGYFYDTVNFAADWSGSDTNTAASGNGPCDIFVSRINANGTYGWTRQMGDFDGDFGRGIRVDSNGNLYVTGDFSYTVNFSADFGGSDVKTGPGMFLTKIIVPPDADNDGLPDAFENSSLCPYLNNPDSDGDGLCDGIFTVPGVCVAGEDLDADGVVDAGESNPCSTDSDGDGINDPSDCAKLAPAHWSDCGLCIDVDGDNYGTNCNLGPDCDDNASTGGGCHSSCTIYYQDNDADTYGGNVSSVRCILPSGYATTNTDCDDNDPKNWTMCATCSDLDGDGHKGQGACNLYDDCNEFNINSWNTCATCLDTDADTWFAGCNQYVTVNGPDCNNADSNNWTMCASCADSDGDGYKGTNCNLPSDCNDANAYSWNTCTTCIDADLDNWYGLCNRYNSDYTITIGSGTGTWNYPFSTFYHDARTQVIYLASEISGAGTISSVALDVTTIPGQVMNNFTIRMKHTSLNSYASASWEGPSSGWTTVYQANAAQGATGWRTFTLTTPFVYNGASNLMVDFSFNNSSYTTDGFVRYSVGGANRSLYYRTDSGSGDPLTWTGTSPAPTAVTNVPNLRLSISGPSINSPDCDDISGITYPGAPEICDLTDNDCDTFIDEGVKLTFFIDSDSDTFGLLSGATQACTVPAGYVTNSADCNDGNAAVHPGQPSPEGPGALCDGLDNNCPGDVGYGEIDEGCVPPDADGDGLSDGQEIIIGTDPNVADSDGDGLSDGEEYLTRGTDPLYWDTDGDALPDAFEVANLSGHTVGFNLNPLLAEGDTADFDRDGNLNIHEYWNGSSPWATNPVGAAGCFFWGDGNGDGYIGPPDNAALTLLLKGATPDYISVIPDTGETQDLNADTYFGPPDMALLTSFQKGQSIPSMPSRPVAIEQLSSGPTSVKVGDTTHLTVGLRNTAGLFTPGFGVVFTIDPTSSGTATILGGDGADGDGHRYDVSGTVTISDSSRVVIRVDSAGEIKINASTPLCGEVLNMGRYCDPLNMSAPFVITGHE